VAKAYDEPPTVVFDGAPTRRTAVACLLWALAPDHRLVAHAPTAPWNGIVRMGHDVRAVALGAREVEVVGPDGDVTRERYDRLVLATGAAPVRPPLPGIDAPGVTSIHSIPDAVALDALLRDRQPRRAVVVGGGYIGLRWSRPSSSAGWSHAGRELPAHGHPRPRDGGQVAGALVALGVRRASASASRVRDRRRWVDHRRRDRAGIVPADAVVLGLGVRPAPSCAARGSRSARPAIAPTTTSAPAPTCAAVTARRPRTG
jgi:NADPH-dependent 2,4-dienoyl-CoA reductase/sulfur reductase-like enzyme